MTLINSTELQYQGYVQTPELWKDHRIFGIEQLTIPSLYQHKFQGVIPENLLLGKRVERFVLNELEQIQNIKILLSNKQVQNEKTTVGEIDCILMQNETLVHLEIVYKFYLFDPTLGTDEIEHWIGPNRNDTLKKKLTKLKDKQLPLLFSKHTKPVLDTQGVAANKVKQRVRFKGQFFIPYKSKIEFKLLNRECLSGFYVYHSEIGQFANCEFYIPDKIDWLIEIQMTVNWNSFEVFQKKLKLLINDKKSPLCWIKFHDGKLEKLFVVWW